MEHRIARAVFRGGVAGAVAGSAVAGKRAERKNTASKENRGNTTSSMEQRAGSKVGAVLDTKNKVKDKAKCCQREYQGYADTDRLCGVFRKGKGKVQRVRL